MPRYLAVLVLLLVANLAIAATLLPPPPGGRAMRLEGKIESGDYERIVVLLKENPEEFIGSWVVALDSPGGSIVEALQIATLFESMGLTAHVPSESSCASACALIFMTAPARVAEGPVALHRPYFLPSTHADVSTLAAMQSQQQVISGTRSFLLDRSVPQRLVERLISTPSTDAYLLTERDQLELGTYSPVAEELAIARCSEPLNGGSMDLADCARAAFEDLRLNAFSELIGRQRAQNALRTALLAAGVRESSSGRMLANGEKSDEREVIVSQELKDAEFDETGTAQFNVMFAKWLSRAKDLEIEVRVPESTIEQLVYLENTLLPALAALGDGEAIFAQGQARYQAGSFEIAMKQFVRAAEFGNLLGASLVGHMYAAGKGVEVDLVRGYAWALVGAQSGSESGRDILEGITSQLTPGQIKEGQSLATQLETRVDRRAARATAGE